MRFKVIAVLGFYLLTLFAIGFSNPALADSRLSQAPSGRTAAAQCTELISIANCATDDVQQISADPAIDSVSGLIAMMSIAEQAITDMQALSLSDTAVLGFRDRFITMYAGTREAGQALIEAVNQGDQAATEAAFVDLQTAISAEDNLVSEVNRYCDDAATAATRSVSSRSQ